MAARSWPGAGPKLHTWDAPGPLLCSAAGQGFRRHLPSQPARPSARCACAVLPLPCRRGLVKHASIGLLGVGRVQGRCSAHYFKLKDQLNPLGG